MKEDKKKVFIKNFGWPLVTVARDGAGDFEEDKCFGVKRLWKGELENGNLINVA